MLQGADAHCWLTLDGRGQIEFDLTPFVQRDAVTMVAVAPDGEDRARSARQSCRRICVVSSSRAWSTTRHCTGREFILAGCVDVGRGQPQDGAKRLRRRAGQRASPRSSRRRTPSPTASTLPSLLPHTPRLERRSTRHGGPARLVEAQDRPGVADGVDVGGARPHA